MIRTVTLSYISRRGNLGDEGEKVFTRRASGLVRVLSPTDSILTNIMATGGIGFTLGYFVLWATGISGGGLTTIVIAMVIACLGCAAQGLMFAMFGATMPRAGGDYLYISRVIHPAVGFMSNSTMAFWLIWNVSWGCFTFSSIGLVTIFGALGSVTGNQGFTNLSASFGTTEWAVVAATVFLGFGSIFVIGRLKNFLRIQLLIAVAGFISLAVIIIVLAVTSVGEFSHTYNQFMQGQGAGPDTYSTVIDDASRFGFNPGAGLTTSALMLAIPFASFNFFWTFCSTYLTGETKNVKKTQIVGMVGSNFVILGLSLVIIVLLFRAVGYDFIASLGYLYQYQPDAYPVGSPAPWFYVFPLMMIKNPAILLLVGFGFVLWAYWWANQNLLFSVRCVFSWSVDKLIPQKFSQVSTRTHTPLFTTIILIAISFIMILMFAYLPKTAIISGILGISIPPYVLSIAGMMLPYKRKDLYEKSPVRWTFLGIPVIVIISAITFLFDNYVFYYFLTDPTLGVIPGNTFAFFILPLPAAVVYFYFARWWRRKEGIDIDLAYKSIPTE
jgi:amino acid transporter